MNWYKIQQIEHTSGVHINSDKSVDFSFSCSPKGANHICGHWSHIEFMNRIYCWLFLLISSKGIIWILCFMVCQSGKCEKKKSTWGWTSYQERVLLQLQPFKWSLSVTAAWYLYNTMLMLQSMRHRAQLLKMFSTEKLFDRDFLVSYLLNWTNDLIELCLDHAKAKFPSMFAV